MATQKEVGAALAKTGEAKPAVNTLQSLVKSMAVKQRFEEMLGKKAAGFMSSILTVANNNKLLATADPATILSAAAVAASLDLSIVPSIGQAHIIPYKDGATGRVVAQFQIGWRGFVQLAQRTGVFKIINADKVFEGQLKKVDMLSGKVELDKDGKTSDVVLGYFAHFELLNGFQKTVYISKADAEKHGKRYSKSYATGQWTKDFDAMAIKTVVKSLLNRWAPLSTDYVLQRGIETDQAVVKDDGTLEYVDTTTGEVIDAKTKPETVDAEKEKLMDSFGK